MSDETYQAKMQSLQQYIPFLVNMMSELKAKGNRTAQLEKMRSLHLMITDSSKKLKLETLNKCEEVLKNIYLKVNPQLLTKVTPGSTESPKNLADIEDPKIQPDIRPLPKNTTNSPNVPVVSSKIVDPRRPIIDLDDVQENVQKKMVDVEYESKTVHELEEVKKKLHQELNLAEAVYQINKTSDSENAVSSRKSGEKSKSSSKNSPSYMKSSGKNFENKSTKVVKEFDMFGNLFPASTEVKNITKKGDRRSSTGSLDSDGKHKEKDKHKHKDKKKDKQGDSRSKNKSDAKDKDSNKHSKEKKHKEDKKPDKVEQSATTTSNALQTPLKTEANTETKNVSERSASEIDMQSLKNTLKRFQTTPAVQSSSSQILTNLKSDNKPVDELLADKFIPKPKALPIELPDVDKAVSDSIESTMESFPIRSLINPHGNKHLTSPPKQHKPTVVIPEILQRIVSQISLGATQNAEAIAPALNDPRSKPSEPQRLSQHNLRTPVVMQSFESPLSPPLQQPTVFELPRHALPSPIPAILPTRYLTPSPIPRIVSPNPELLGRPFMQQTGTGILTTPQASFSHVDSGVVNMDLGTPRSDFTTPRADFGTPRADFGTPRADFGTPRPDFIAPRADFVAPRADFAIPRSDFAMPRPDYGSVMTPRPDFDSPPANNCGASQFNGNNQFDSFVPENQMHRFNQRNDNNFMGPGHFIQQSGNLNPYEQSGNLNPYEQSGNLNPYDLAQNALIQQEALSISHTYTSYQASQGFYPQRNQMQINTNYEQTNYFCEEQPLYQERPRWPGRNSERGRRPQRPQGPANYGEYREMRQRHEREAKMAQEHNSIKDPRLKPREIKEEDATEMDNRDPRLSRGRERLRSRDRSPSEEKVESRDPRLKAKLKDSKFDKIYSKYGQKKEDDDEAFGSPLNSLYNAGEGRTGRGYGVQSFKIPKKSRKPEIIKDQRKTEEKRSSSETRSSISSNSGTMEKSSSASDEQTITSASDKQTITSASDKQTSISTNDTHNDSSDKQSNSSKKRRNSGGCRKRIVSESDESEINDNLGILDEADCGHAPTMESTEELVDEDAHRAQHVETPQYDIALLYSKASEWVDDNSFVSEYNLECQNEIEKEESKENRTHFEETISVADSINELNESQTVSNNKEPEEKTLISGSPPKNKSVQEGIKIAAKNKQIDECPSSKDDLEPHPSQAIIFDKKIEEVKSVSSTEIPKEPEVESNDALDRSKNVNETDTSQEAASSKDSSTDILQIVKHVLDTPNTQDESTRICSLLESFLGKLHSQQVQRVRSMLNKDQSNKEQNPESNEATKEQQIVTSTVKERGSDVENKDLPTSTINTNETQVNEVTESLEHSEIEELCNQGDLDPEPIVVSVGERIKNRKRASQVTAAQKKKSELDLLHADIQDMFIRDGVLKATGKRKCAQKDDSNVLLNTEQQSIKPPSLDESKVIKKRGPKRKVACNSSEMPILKQMKIIIKKIPDDVLKAASGRSRQTSLAESDLDASENVSYDHSISEFEEESLKDFAETQKPRTRRRKTAKWASGIISKPKKKKSQELKSKENSPVRSASVASETASLSDSDMNEIPVEPDIDYYYDYTTKSKLNCKLCQYSGHWMTAHYLKEHPESEVLTSRLAPQAAAEAIEDFALNEETFTNVANKKLPKGKFRYSCRMCGYASFISPQFFYEHVTTHTGEYRHECGLCEYIAASEKSMTGHYLTFHPDKDISERTATKRLNFAIVFAYMCSECNFVQLKEKSLQDHVKVHHFGVKSTIHKINMSTILDLPLTKAESSDFTIQDSSDALPVKVSATRVRKPTLALIKPRKPGPKSKTMPVPQIHNENLSGGTATLALTHRRKPGPKSKTRRQSKDSVSEETTEQESQAKIPALRSKSKAAIASSLKHSQEDVVAPVRKRRRSLENLINKDSKDDFDAIVTLSSRSTRAAKEKATAKLKTLMESNELGSIKKRSDQESVEEQSEHEESNGEKTNVAKDGTVVQDHSEEEVVKVGKSSATNINEMAPPVVENKSSERDLNVFTCRSDILQEQAKTIEEDRLRQMDEVNKSFAAKPKLDFINKLSNRLNSAQELDAIRIKKEPQESPDTTRQQREMPLLQKHVTESSIETPPFVKPLTPPAMFEKTEVEEEPSVQTCSIKFRQNRVNNLFSNTIQKLQGKIKEAVEEDLSKKNENGELSIQDEASNGELPPEIPESFISIGDLIRATKIGSDILYSCHVNNCNFTSKDKTVFKIHCKLGIHKNLKATSSLCDRCGVVVTITQDTTLLENLYDHLVFAHGDFISPMSLVRMRRLSGDKLSIKKEPKTDDTEEQKSKEILPLRDIEAELDACLLVASKSNTPSLPISDNCPPLQMIKDSVVTSISKGEPVASAAIIEPTDDTSYGFKIVDVTSLADSDPSYSASPIEPVAAAVTKLPPLVLVSQEEPTSPSKVIREAKLTSLEASRPRKGAKALQSLIETPSNLYKCPHFFCKFSSNVRTMFVFHLKEHTSDNTTMVPCVYCDVKTPWDHVPMHIDIRHAASRHTCRHCLYRAVAPEYVCLHLEQYHPNQAFVVISVPPHKAAKKFSAADMKIDCKQLCEPFRCVCANEDGKLKSHEYLFENEFVKHLKIHKQESIQCGYPTCFQKLDPSSMLNHWALVHKVRTYQCSYCKVNSKDIHRMYSHFAEVHPNMMPNILVRKNESSLPKHKEVGYTDEAYQYLGHIRKFPATLISVIKNRSKCQKIKIIESDASNTTEESTMTLTPPKTSPSNTLFLPMPQNNSQLLLTNPNLKLLVASTSTNEKVLLLSTNSMVSQSKIPSVTSTASLSKVLGQTSAASTLKHLGPIGKVLLQTPTGSTTPPNLVPIRVGAHASTASSTQTLNSQEPVRFGGITIYPPDVPEDNQARLTTASATAVSGNLFYTSPGVTLTKPIQSRQEVANIAEVLPVSSAVESENNIPILTEDHILQSAIQSILDFGDESNNASLDSLYASSTSLYPEHSSQNPPPLVLLSSGPSNSSALLQNKGPIEVMAPIEHINVNEQQEDLQLESNSESVTELFISDDNLLSEDPLNLLSDLVLDLDAPMTELLEPVIAPPSEETAANPIQQKLSVLHGSGSYRESTDEESDSSISEKKMSGLSGYQLYRCAMCNLSFSTFEAFKKHLSTSITCKKPGPKAYQCAHCCKGFITPQRLAKHIFSHGVLRFFCGLCNEKFNTVESTKMHLKTRHSILQFNMAPLKADKNNVEVDEFMFIPRNDKEVATCAPKLSVDSCTYNPDEINSIPIRQIFNTNVKCGKCNFQTKVRVNIIRHLQMHLDEKAVPDTAPVNPVPCLEKNEKMFDKMCNLAASSFPTGRMGGPPAVKEKDQEKEKHPEFVPSHRRFVCCAQGCSYLCPEESNLKHHIMALHSDEANFTCAHCKVAIDSSDVENVIKHFKLHGLYLYKCQYCSFVHYLKHKVEKHIVDGHQDLAVKVITVRCMESEPEFTSEHHDNMQPVALTPKFKPWSCCMCKAKYHTKDEILTHIVKKHNIDAQYKCTLCAFKDDQENVCREHFKEKHPDNAFDIILVYRETEEESLEDTSITPFDTTPLWQRDKPRVRHIRGILFDESVPPLTKSPKKKVLPKQNTTWKTSVASTSSAKNTPSPVPASRSIVSRNIFDCIDEVARGTAEILKGKPEADPDKPGPSGISMAKTTSGAVVRDNSFTSNNSVSTENTQNRPGGHFITKTPPITLVSKDKSGQKPSISSEVSSSQPAPVILNKYFSNPRNPDNALKLNISLDKIINNALEKNITISTPIQDTRIDSDESDDVVLISPPIPNITVIDSDESDVEQESKPFVEAQDSYLDLTSSIGKGQKRPGTTDLLQEAVKMARIDETDDASVALRCSRENLVYMFGAIGKPNNKQLKCPRCSTFRSKKAADFIFHLYQEFNFHRYQCKGCDYSSVTYKFMLDHLQMHHPDATVDLSQPLPPYVELDTWIQMVIREQSKEILELSHELFQKRPVPGSFYNKCYFCNDTFISVSECNEHMFYHWVLMPYQCQHCPHEFYTIYDLRHHHSIEHPDLVLYAEPKGPTLAQALACIENTKQKVLKTYSVTDRKKGRVEESKEKIPITSGMVINTPKVKKLATSLDDNAASNSEAMSNNGDEVFACEICAYYGYSETNIKQHLEMIHQIIINKFHILSNSKSEKDFWSKMACNICDEVFTEVKLRKHFLELHQQSVFVPYKYKCLTCQRKFCQVVAVKMHCSKFHPLSRPSYECVITKNKFAFDTAKQKSKCISKFSCSLCSFVSIAKTAQSIKLHVKGHFRPALCNICQKSFRNHYECIKHTDKVHKGLDANYSISSIITRECNKVITDICNTAVPVKDEPSTSEAQTSSPKMPCAKKSTASLFNSRPITYVEEEEEEEEQEEEEGYSYYGMDEPQVDLTNLMTTFEMDSLEYTTTAEEMKKLINLDAFVDLSDCLVDENIATGSS